MWRRQHGQAAARVIGMRAARIAPQIGPIGVRRIGPHSARPGQRLAPRRQHRPDTLGLPVIGVGGQKLLIARQCVALDHRRIGVGCRIVADRLLAAAGDRRQGSRGTGGRLKKQEWRVNMADVPGHGNAPGCFIDAQPGAGKHIVQRQAGLAQHFGQCLGIKAVGTGTFRGNRAGGRVEGDQRARIGIDQGKAARQRRAGAHKSIRPCAVNHDNSCGERRGSQRPCEIGQAQGLDRHAGIARQRRIDGHQVIFAGKLDGMSGQIDKGDGFRASRLGPVEKLPQGLAQPVLVKVAQASDIKARRAQGFCQQARIIDRCRQRASAIGRLADDQRQPLLRSLRQSHAWHGTPNCPAHQHSRNNPSHRQLSCSFMRMQ